MIAGTLAQLESPADDPLESWIRDRDNSLPAIQVRRSQDTMGDATPQSGTVAARIEQTKQNVTAGVAKSNGDSDDLIYVDTERVETLTTLATDWYADVTGSGLLLAESIAGDDELPFPFDVLAARAGSDVYRLEVDIEHLHDAWGGDALEVWMTGSDDDGSTMAYHDSADVQEIEPTIGLGFKRAWSGTTIRGIVWASGYVALYSARHPADGLQFLADEILPYTGEWSADEHQDQTDFDDFGSGA